MTAAHIIAAHQQMAGPYLDTSAAAIVITSTDVVIRSGITITQVPTPAGLLSGPAQLLDWAATFGREVTLVVQDMGIPRDALRPMATHAGWTLPPLREADSWTPCRREIDGHAQAVYLCVIAWSQPDPMLEGSPQAIVSRLWEWYRTTGVCYRYSPGASALAGLVASKMPARRRLQDPATAEYWQPPGQITDLRYAPRRMPAGRLHRWDMRAAYLAAAAAVELPARQLQHTGYDYADNVVGYFWVRPGDRPQGGLGATDRQGRMWVTHSMLELLQPIEIVDSWTSEDHARFLRPWAERWRDLVMDPGRPIRTQYKMAYTQAIGLMSVPRGSFYRPDWRHMIIDRVRWSMVRRIRRVVELTGLSPVRVDVDSVWYDTDDPGLVSQAIGDGGHAGHMRYEGAGRLVRNDYGWRWIPDEAS